MENDEGRGAGGGEVGDDITTPQKNVREENVLGL